VWDRYLQVVIVKLDAINAATTSDESRMYYFTDMAQGQRAGLITPRSLDRNGLSVSYSFCAKDKSYFTDMAQR